MFNVIAVIPAYKPTSALLELIEQLEPYFPRIIVVDDGSGKEFSVFFETIEQKPRCVVVHHYVNMGKGRALKTAFNYCLGINDMEVTGVVTIDADGQHVYKDVVRICEGMEMSPDKIVLGCRKFDDKKIPLRSRLGNKISRYVYSWLCGIKVSDTQTGLRGLPRCFLEIACQIQGERYEYETNMLLAAKDNEIKFAEIPIETVYTEKNESSHFKPFIDSIKIYTVILKYSMSSLLSVIIDYGVWGMLTSFGVPIWEATYISRACAAGVNFGINRNIVFKNKSNIGHQLVKYLLLLIISGTISGACVTYCSNLFEVNGLIIKVVIEVVLYFANYYVQRAYIFVRD